MGKSNPHEAETLIFFFPAENIEFPICHIWKIGIANFRTQEFLNTTSFLGSFLGIHFFLNTNLPLWCDFVSSSLNSISSADAKRSGVKSTGSEGSAPINSSVIPVDYKSFKTTWTEVVHINRERWRAKVPKGNMLLGNLPGDLSRPT